MGECLSQNLQACFQLISCQHIASQGRYKGSLGISASNNIKKACEEQGLAYDDALLQQAKDILAHHLSKGDCEELSTDE